MACCPPPLDNFCQASDLTPALGLGRQGGPAWENMEHRERLAEHPRKSSREAPHLRSRAAHGAEGRSASLLSFREQGLDIPLSKPLCSLGHWLPTTPTR